MFFNSETGELFEGWFKDNKILNGRCIQNDTYYVGSFASKRLFSENELPTFVKQGYGTSYYSNGTNYQGNWKNNEKQAPGIYTYANKMTCSTGMPDVDP